MFCSPGWTSRLRGAHIEVIGAIAIDGCLQLRHGLRTVDVLVHNALDLVDLPHHLHSLCSNYRLAPMATAPIISTHS